MSRLLVKGLLQRVLIVTELKIENSGFENPSFSLLTFVRRKHHMYRTTRDYLSIVPVTNQFLNFGFW